MTSLRGSLLGALRVRGWPLSAYFVVLVGLFVVAAASTALYVSAQTERDGRRAAQADALFAAQTAAKQLGNQLALTEATVAQLASNPQITQVFSQTEPCSLTFGGISGPDRSHLDIVGADGVVACSSRPQSGAKPESYSAAEWLRPALSAPVFIAPAKDGATGASVAISAASIPGRKGAVVAFVELAPIGPHLASLYGGVEPAEFLITSSDRRTVIARSIEPQRWVGASLADTPFASAENSVERSDLDGTSRLYAEARVESTGWRLHVGEDKSSALAAGERLERRQLGIIGVGLLAVLLAAWFAHRTLVSPIRRLSAALRAPSAEALPAKSVPVGGPAELTALGKDVNSLMSAVDRELVERRRAEESARASERNYRLLFESNPNAMWVYDSETLRFLAINDAAVQGYGYTREEFLAMTIEDIRPVEDVPQLHAIVRPDHAGEERGLNAAGTWRHRRKDGTLLDAEVTSHAHVFEGRPARVVLAVDVTARVEAERALRQSEARYRDLFENATDLIAMVDLDSRLTMVNESFVRALGYTRDELLGRPLRELVPPEWHERLEDARGRKMGEDVDETTYEHELVAKDGHRLQVEVASRVIEVDGDPIGVEAICRDITERRHLEEQLRQAQRLEAIGRLAGGIAHDFNNLLTVISGYADALLEEGDPASESELKEIAAAAERATILTRQLLAFSRRQVLQPRVLDLNEVVEGITPMLMRLIGEDVDLVTALDPRLEHVLADPNQIEQVLLNLVINARDAMPQGGKLTIGTGNTELDESYVAEHPEARVGRHATLTVSDNGVGMDADTVARVFEPFFTTKAVGTGTGLGLSTVYGIVKQSGGNTWIYSEPGRGSTFKVYLPAADAPLTAVRRDRSEVATPTGSETILIVEDEDAVRTLAATMLKGRGYTVRATGSAEEALRMAVDGEPIDLLLTDLVMPEMNGRDLAARVLEAVPTVRVLFMSGYADEAVARNGALEAGAAYLEKPFSGRDLAHRVRQTLDEPSAASRQLKETADA
jgi:two-component system cell cycle sensor histidine kinase/response regulator CckA